MSAWRELSDDELLHLSQECERRVQGLVSQGVQFNTATAGIDLHYMTIMLEELLGERATASAREKHLKWLKEALDTAEQQIRQAKFTQGIAGYPNGQAHGHG